VTTFLTAFRFQSRLTWSSMDTLQVCVTAPLFTLFFLSIADAAGRDDLARNGVVAAGLISLWTVVLLFAGQIITEERQQGTLEGLVAAPAPIAVVVLGRLMAVAVAGIVPFAEAWLVTGLVFGQWQTVHHPVVLAAALAATALATAGTASVLSPLFVLMPSARIIQNTLTYPFYLLGGVVVPVAVFPDWLEPLSRIAYLSWAADLLRDVFDAGPVEQPAVRVAIVVGYGIAGFAVGATLLHLVLRRVRRSGTLNRT
jgi:ABC-2 type transport system permease protein